VEGEERDMVTQVVMVVKVVVVVEQHTMDQKDLGILMVF